MKWFSLLVAAFVSLNLLSASPALTESDKPVVIQKISHTIDSKTQETITIQLAATVEPKIFILRGEKPRLVIDLPQSIYRGSNTIPLEEGRLASAIRLGLHHEPVERTRAVIDLSKETVVQYKSEYQQEENVLVVTLTGDLPEVAATGETGEDANGVKVAQVVEAEKVAEANESPASVPILAAPTPAVKSVPDLKTEEEKELPREMKAEIKQVEKTVVTKAIVPEDTKQQVTVQVPQTEAQAMVVVEPTILDISFDDSSGKGEMVLFQLNSFKRPTVAAIETGSPRVLCDFPEMVMGDKVQENIQVNAKFIDRIRTAKHKNPDKVRVVLDLTPDRDYDLKQIYYRNDNLFVLIVNELPQHVITQ